jgi:hypothetical protein
MTSGKAKSKKNDNEKSPIELISANPTPLITEAPSIIQMISNAV